MLKSWSKKSDLRKKIEILGNALQNPHRMYSGRSIKRFIKSKALNLHPYFNNKSIKAGRWSAYCHHSQRSSLQNLLARASVNTETKVLVHPLISPLLMEEIIKSRARIFSRDIDNNTLQFIPNQLEDYLKEGGEQFPDLVVLNSNVGVYKSLLDIVKIFNEFSVPVILIIENNYLTSDLLDLFNFHDLGGVIWDYGENFWDKHLDEAIDQDLDADNWYLSWYMDARVLSVPEYHLYESNDVFEEMLEALYYVYLDNYTRDKWWGSGFKHLYRWPLKKKHVNPDKARDLIITDYKKTHTAAVPDVVFDLQINAPKPFHESHTELLGSQQELQNISLRFYNFLKDRYKFEEEKTLEIPAMYLDQVYLDYFFYTTKSKEWKEEFRKLGYAIDSLCEIHSMIRDNPNFPIANYVANYGLKVDLVNLYNKIKNNEQKN